MALPGAWNTLTGGIIGAGVGIAAADALSPLLEPEKQQAWRNNRYRLLDVGALARLRAQGLLAAGAADYEAGGTGFAPNRLRALEQLALVAPPYSLALELRRKGHLSADQFAHALAKAQLELDYHDALSILDDEHLNPAVIALAIVRGIIRDPGFLPVGPPAEAGKVQAFPVSSLDALAEAKGSGWNRERLFVQTAISGRPMGPEGAAQAAFRGIIERADYDRAIAEGDVRNEWADAIYEAARAIPSVADYVNAHLRGWIDEQAMNAGVARHGMSPADAHLLYLRTGRPAAPGQMATAAARGIDGPEGRPMDREQFLKGIAESDIRPEWGPMLWESRYLYPPLFQLTRLVQAGAITPELARDWARKDRYPPEVVDALYAYWSQPSGSSTSSHVGKARTQLWTTTHRSYIASESDDADASAALELVGVAAADVAKVLELWQAERALIRKQLTPTQVKKALANGVTNPATGAAWTLDEATEALLRRGYSLGDAQTFLAT